MPIYEYRCDKGHTFEAVQRMTDDPIATCEACGRPVQRVFHPVAVHFKGKGFYNTDYGTRNRERETAANGASSDRSSDKTSSGEGAKSSDSGSSNGKVTSPRDKGETKRNKRDGAKPSQPASS